MEEIFEVTRTDLEAIFNAWANDALSHPEDYNAKGYQFKSYGERSANHFINIFNELKGY